MAKGKRMADAHSSKSTHKRFQKERQSGFKKFFIILLVILIFAGCGYLAYKYVPKLINQNKTSSSEFEATSSADIRESKTIEGLESVSVTGIDISISNKDTSIIGIHFKNSSNLDTKETKAHFYAIDSEGNTIFGMPLTIPTLTANSETTYKVLCTNDLSEAKDYRITIE